MMVKVLYFGMIADTLSKTEEEIQMDITQDEINLKSFFNSRYPQLESLNYSVAVNQEFKEKITIDNTIKEIALLPPFAGG